MRGFIASVSLALIVFAIGYTIFGPNKVSPRYTLASGVRPVPGNGACIQVRDKDVPGIFLVCAKDGDEYDASKALDFSCEKVISNGYALQEWHHLSCSAMIQVAATKFDQGGTA